MVMCGWGGGWHGPPLLAKGMQALLSSRNAALAPQSSLQHFGSGA